MQRLSASPIRRAPCNLCSADFAGGRTFAATLLDSLNEDNRRDIAQKLKENLALEDKLREQADQILKRELANYTMTEQQRTEIVAALLRRFPKLAIVKLEPEAIAKALETIDWHTSKIARTMIIDDCTPTEAIAAIDRLNMWRDADLTEPDKSLN